MELRELSSRGQKSKIVLFEALGGASLAHHAALLQHGYEVDLIHRADTLMRLPLREYQLAILQWRIPGEPSGLVLARQVRSRSASLGIMMLDEVADALERQQALDELVDDCLGVNCDVAELLSHVNALTRRLRSSTEFWSAVDFGPVRVDFTGGFVEVAGEEVSLQPLQLRIFGFLLKHAGRIVSHEELRRHVFRAAQAATSTSLSRQVSVLRKRLGAAGEMIVTSRGGYGIGVPSNDSW